jgi:hypothetical protein
LSKVNSHKKQSHMFKTIVTVIALLVNTNIKAQYLLNYDSGEQVRHVPYANYHGSPYLFSEWLPSIIKIGNNVYHNVFINIDLYANKAFYKRNDSVFAFRDEVNEFLVVQNTDTVLYKRGQLLNDQLPSSFVEVISNAPLVVKHVKLNVSEQVSYGSGTKEYRFNSVKEYYTQKGNSVERIKLSKEEAKEIFHSKWGQIDAFAAAQGISFKNEEGWRKLAKQFQAL